ncbi:MAG: YciI-like protein [Dehalococcoidia bacterium]
MYYLLLYDVVDNYIERRALFREEHLGLAREAHARGELLMAGAFADPVDGAALLFSAEDRSVAERFAENDPYVRGGLVTHWRVRGWTEVLGGQ